MTASPAAGLGQEGERSGHHGGATFDALAARYDQVFGHSALGLALRESVHRHLGRRTLPGQRWLDIGCGTGEDAMWLADQGAAEVLAVDSSARMLDLAEAKARAAGWPPQRLRFAQLDLSDDADLARLADESSFDGILADFGVINCLPRPAPMAAALACILTPSGRFTAVTMGPTCLWEWADAALTGQWKRLVRRRRNRWFRTASGSSPLWYPSPRDLRRAFAPALLPSEKPRPLGLLLPPSDAAAWLRARPKLLGSLAMAERMLAPAWPLAWLSDHYVMDFRVPAS